MDPWRDAIPLTGGSGISRWLFVGSIAVMGQQYRRMSPWIPGFATDSVHHAHRTESEASTESARSGSTHLARMYGPRTGNPSVRMPPDLFVFSIRRSIFYDARPAGDSGFASLSNHPTSSFLPAERNGARVLARVDGDLPPIGSVVTAVAFGRHGPILYRCTVVQFNPMKVQTYGIGGYQKPPCSLRGRRGGCETDPTCERE